MLTAASLALCAPATWAQETVVVSAQRGQVVTPSAVTQGQMLAGEALLLRRQGSLGETLAGLPGVHLDNFGGGAGRPVIRVCWAYATSSCDGKALNRNFVEWHKPPRSKIQDW